MKVSKPEKYEAWNIKAVMTKNAKTYIPVQKGPIDANMKVNKTQTYNEKVAEGKARHLGIKGMQECKLKEPKR